MKMNTHFAVFIFLCFSIGQAFSLDSNLIFSEKIPPKERHILEKIFKDISPLLPASMKLKLPTDLKIEVQVLNNQKLIPEEICNDKIKEKAFVFAKYEQRLKTILIAPALLSELIKGNDKIKLINCHGRDLYEQTVATIVHELAHAYDFQNGRISNSPEFLRMSGFKKGILKTKNKNVQAMRSVDPHELASSGESFAVNVEYFILDEEFFCRKPSMFNYLKEIFGIDPFPQRKCRVSDTVLVSTPNGELYPLELKSSSVYRIDYLIASKGNGISSGFGHSMFRIVMCAPQRIDSVTQKIVPPTPFGNKCLEDKMYHLVVSYRANVADAKLNYMKGLFGGYPSMLFILNFPDVLNEYNNDELRDVISYPLNLTAKEKNDFILKVKEEHWNYRGSYKFINNNCATESYDLLKSVVNEFDLSSKKSFSPYGVLEDMDTLNILSVKDTQFEMFESFEKEILLAYQSAYGEKVKKIKKNKKDFLNFVDKSTASFRFNTFFDFVKINKEGSGNLNEEISNEKENLTTMAAFVLVEQQILRMLKFKYKNRFIELLDKNKIEINKKTTSRLLPEGYGIPLEHEIHFKEDEISLGSQKKEDLIKIENLLKELMPKEVENLENINKNIESFSAQTFLKRRSLREKIDEYIKGVLKNLSHDELMLEMMKKAASGDGISLKKVRDLLGKDIVSDRELLDLKLKKLIQEYL